MSEFSRAVVLGGGGVAGIAWETGLVAGLASQGVNLADADLIVGTSAGAAVTAQITSSSTPESLYADQINDTGAPEPKIDVDMDALLAEISEILANELDPVTALKRVGELALEKDRVPESERRQIIEARLADYEWPKQLIKLTAVEATTGQFVVFDNNSGVGLVDAVTASCALPRVWPAATINGSRYYDGGIRSSTNADVAKDYDRILVVEVLKLPETADVCAIEDRSKVLEISPDEASKRALESLMDPAARPACAKAGYEQGVVIAAQVRGFWG
ncbi:patatin-like phospholipase family protein [Cryobacterium sp. Y50]|uniref:patatin-like phospholipase family protein n=1 Tax=Cryobacterium sp. Y50 TaxID=2048286 RepID=UPI000CE3A7AA|nr:patatin-like phospholipase family protein [Cryobacterium sp. Y50]